MAAQSDMNQMETQIDWLGVVVMTHGDGGKGQGMVSPHKQSLTQEGTSNQ